MKSININEKTRIYVLCPPNVKTGGTELLHQLNYWLGQNGYNSYITYYCVDKSDNSNLTPKDFEIYVKEYKTESDIEDDENNIIIIPEIDVKMAVKYKKAMTIIWWLSVDNYKNNRGLRNVLKNQGIIGLLKSILHKNLILNDKYVYKADYHLCQSYYAIDFLNNLNVKNCAYLSDYVNDMYLNAEYDIATKEDIVLYNPKKGKEFTEKIIKSSNFKFVPIENLTTEGVKNLLLKSKVYIDFGHHPGKDRFPREAAMCGCCIITGKRGAAKFYNDVPINEEFKFDDDEKSIGIIINKIQDCIEDYEKNIEKFDSYRKFIKNEKQQFIDDIKNIFKK